MTAGEEPPRYDSVRFTVRIGHFSKVSTRTSVFTSQVFRNSASGTGWSLQVHTQDSGSTVFRLQRSGCRPEAGSQSASVRLTVVDCLGSRLLSAKRQLYFGGAEGEARPVMRLKGEQVVGCLGLKSLCFLPNDTLTLRCEVDETEAALGDQVVIRRRAGRCVRSAGWRDSYILSVPETGMPLA